MKTVNARAGKQVAAFAILVRCIVVTLSIVSNACVGDYDSSNSILASSQVSTESAEGKAAGWLVENTLGSLARWDSVHLLGIAEKGYVYEHNHAFYPLYPMVSRLVAETALSPLLGILHLRHVLIVAGVLISNVCAVVAAVLLYRLGVVVMNCERTARASAVLFCFGPASVFYSAPYTESLYAMISFGCMLGAVKMERGKGLAWVWWGVMVVAASLACLTRANGTVLVGYLLYPFARRLCRKEGLGAGRVLQVVIGAALIAASAASVQWYGRQLYCPWRPWCSSSHMYSHVQAEYWNVGWFAFYTLKQLPNFLLASPTLALATMAAISYARASPKRFLTLGLATIMEAPKRGISEYQRSDMVLPFVFHMIALMVAAIPLAHIQILTRLLSACPPIYWHAADLMLTGSPARKALLLYFLLYNAVGILLFCNFLPWT